jgi:hypothetical protein
MKARHHLSWIGLKITSVGCTHFGHILDNECLLENYLFNVHTGNDPWKRSICEWDWKKFSISASFIYLENLVQYCNASKTNERKPYFFLIFVCTFYEDLLLISKKKITRKLTLELERSSENELDFDFLEKSLHRPLHPLPPLHRPLGSTFQISEMLSGDRESPPSGLHSCLSPDNSTVITRMRNDERYLNTPETEDRKGIIL